MLLPSPKDLIGFVELAGSKARFQFGKSLQPNLEAGTIPMTQIPYDSWIAQYPKVWAEKFPTLGTLNNGVCADFSNKTHLLIVDPLDGAEAFRRGLPVCTISATIMELSGAVGRPLLSVIHNLVTGETWSALRGAGCYKKSHIWGTKLVRVCRPTDNIKTAIWARKGCSHNLQTIAHHINDNELFVDEAVGDAFGLNAALIAQGTLDATVCGTGNAQKIAAMSHLVAEAGGLTIDLNGDPLTTFTLGDWHGTIDFLLPHGAIVATNQQVARCLHRYIARNQ